jgi:hypothetical protein
MTRENDCKTEVLQFNLIFSSIKSFLFETMSYYAAQAGLELMMVLLPQPPQCYDYRMCHTPSLSIFFKSYFSYNI